MKNSPNALKIMAALFVGVALSSASASAQTGTADTWTLNTTGNWDTGTNWSLSAAPTATNDAYFGNSAATEIITNGATDTALGIYSNNTSTTEFTGGSITVGTDGITQTAGTGILDFASDTLVVNGSQTWNFNTGTSDINNITGNATTGNTETLNFSGPGTFNQNNQGGLISNGSGGGTLALEITNGAYWENTKNTNANTFSGGLSIVNGTAYLNTVGQIGNGTVTLGSSTASAAGATLTLRNGGSTNDGFVVLASGVSTLTNGSNGSTDTFGGNVSLGSNLNVYSSANTGSSNTYNIFNGTISGTGSLTVSQPGGDKALIVTLNGNNSYSGGTAISGSILDINTATAIGSGTLTITGGTIDNTSGSDVTESNNNAMTIGGTLTFGGSNNLNFGTGATSLNNATRTITTNGTGTLTIGGVISDGAGTGAGGITKAGVGTLVLNGANTYTGTTSVTAGTLSGNTTVAALSLSNAVGANITPGTAGATNTTMTASSFTWAGTTSAAAAAGSTLTFTLSGTDNTSNLLAVTGALTGTTGTNFDFNLSGGVAGDTYTLIDFGSTNLSASDTFVNDNAGSVNGTFSLNANSLTFTVAAAPEPSTWAMLFGGLAVLVCWQRARRRLS